MLIGVFEHKMLKKKWFAKKSQTPLIIEKDRKKQKMFQYLVILACIKFIEVTFRVNQKFWLTSRRFELLLFCTYLEAVESFCAMTFSYVISSRTTFKDSFYRNSRIQFVLAVIIIYWLFSSFRKSNEQVREQHREKEVCSELNFFRIKTKFRCIKTSHDV